MRGSTANDATAPTQPSPTSTHNQVSLASSSGTAQSSSSTSARSSKRTLRLACMQHPFPAQGRTAELCTWSSSGQATREGTYVAITRARQQTHIYAAGQPDTPHLRSAGSKTSPSDSATPNPTCRPSTPRLLTKPEHRSRKSHPADNLTTPAGGRPHRRHEIEPDEIERERARVHDMHADPAADEFENRPRRRTDQRPRRKRPLRLPRERSVRFTMSGN